MGRAVVLAVTATLVAAPAALAQPRPFLDVRGGAPARFVAGRPALTAPSRDAPADVAARAVRAVRGRLGLGAADLGSLRLVARAAIPGGATTVAYRQYVDGIASFDGGVRVVVDAAGRALQVAATAAPGTTLNTTQPALDAAAALRRLRDDVGAGGTELAPARLTAFVDGSAAHLAWVLDYRAEPLAHYTAVVDAVDGAILYRANTVRTAGNEAQVFDQYPGAANGGVQRTVDLTPYLDAGASDLSGPYARAWSDVDDDAVKDSSERVLRTGGGDFTYAFSDFTTSNSNGACDAAHRCSWNFDVPTSWQTNRAQDAVQAFWYVNRFRDHLAAAPISFTAADGNFDNGDPVLVNSDDGAATAGNGGPDGNHVDNAYMDTGPDGESPRMAMFLFFNDGDFRDVNGGDDAEIVYHEYTHGLSSRLITTAGGDPALNTGQAASMGEGWSDFYAKDFLIDEFPGDDTAATGDVDMGKYVDSVPHQIRSQGLDCPVGSTSSGCPHGGYSYGFYNSVPKVFGQAEPHLAGEIWGETLWDLRGALGSETTDAIVTQGMRLSPPEPTFLDERDAIVEADRQLFPDGDHSGAIWQVFARRGMGWNATSAGKDGPVVAGAKRPPTAALAVASSAEQGRPTTLDASGSSDPDGTVVSYDFDAQGDGTNEITGTTNSRFDVTYAATGTYHPVVTVHDNEGRTDTASRTVTVGPPSTSTGSTTTTTTTTGPAPGAGVSPVTVSGAPPAALRGLAPVLTLPRSGSRSRVRLGVACDSACSGTATLTVTRATARRLGIAGRTVGSIRFRRVAAGRAVVTVRLTARTVRALIRRHMTRLTTRLTVRVTDAERQITTRTASVRVRR